MVGHFSVILTSKNVYQVNNDFEEVLSVRKTALKNGHILPLKTERNDKYDLN